MKINILLAGLFFVGMSCVNIYSMTIDFEDIGLKVIVEVDSPTLTDESMEILGHKKSFFSRSENGSLPTKTYLSNGYQAGILAKFIFICDEQKKIFCTCGYDKGIIYLEKVTDSNEGSEVLFAMSNTAISFWNPATGDCLYDQELSDYNVISDFTRYRHFFIFSTSESILVFDLNKKKYETIFDLSVSGYATETILAIELVEGNKIGVKTAFSNLIATIRLEEI